MNVLAAQRYSGGTIAIVRKLRFANNPGESEPGRLPWMTTL